MEKEIKKTTTTKKKRMLAVEELPPGYNFKPTDKELLTMFLRRKASGQNLPRQFDNTIIHRNLYDQQKPWEIFDEKITPRVNFTWIKTLFDGGSRMERKVRDGTWRMESTEKPIFDDNDGVTLLGFKKVLNFYDSFVVEKEDGNDNRKSKKKKKTKGNTKWIMHEYTLSNNSNSVDNQERRLALCRIKRGKVPPVPVMSSTAGDDAASSTCFDPCYSSSTATTHQQKRPLELDHGCQVVDHPNKCNKTSSSYDHAVGSSLVLNNQDYCSDLPLNVVYHSDHHDHNDVSTIYNHQVSSLQGFYTDSSQFQPSCYPDHDHAIPSGDKSYDDLMISSDFNQCQPNQQQPLLVSDFHDNDLPSVERVEWSSEDLTQLIHFDPFEEVDFGGLP